MPLLCPKNSALPQSRWRRRLDGVVQTFQPKECVFQTKERRLMDIGTGAMPGGVAGLLDLAELGEGWARPERDRAELEAAMTRRLLD